MAKLEVGTKVYLRPINNAARRSKDILEREITKVGRKYFEVGIGYAAIKFYVEDLREVTNYAPDWQLYFDLQEILDEDEKQKRFWKTQSAVSGYSVNACKLSLDQLRRICAIIDEK